MHGVGLGWGWVCAWGRVPLSSIRVTLTDQPQKKVRLMLNMRTALQRRSRLHAVAEVWAIADAC